MQMFSLDHECQEHSYGKGTFTSGLSTLYLETENLKRPKITAFILE